ERWPNEPSARIGVIDAMSRRRPIGAGASGVTLDDFRLLDRTTEALPIDKDRFAETIDAILGPVR
ncbi:MAG: hypothetical protein AAF805_03225, partial [Planctomycetota bacterium]